MIQPAYTSLLSDLETPVSAFQKLSHLSALGFLLESAEGDSRMARFSLLGIRPRLAVQFRDGLATLTNRAGAETTQTFENPLQFLKHTLAKYQPDFAQALAQLPASLQALPFLGGWVGYMGYGATQYFEAIPQQAEDPFNVPDGYWGLYDNFLIFDHLYRRLHVISLSGENELALMLEALTQTVTLPSLSIQHLDLSDDVVFNHVHSRYTAESFSQLVETAKALVHQGQVFQIVPSHRFSLPVKAAPYTMYRLVQAINPSPYGYYLQFPGFCYLGSSPETFLTCNLERRVILRALAGTRPRGKSPKEDAALREELTHDQKELAEHHMLVDLGRNDLGRVCEVGSIAVGDIAQVVGYTHVMHLSTEMQGTLKPDKTAYEMAQSCFPRGTLTGAPKIRAMQLLSQLEPERRGVYAGLVGYFDHRGQMDSAIAIRSVLVKDGVAHVNAGAGVVFDSDPLAEYEETRNKARSMLKAIQLAEQLEHLTSF